MLIPSWQFLVRVFLAMNRKRKIWETKKWRHAKGKKKIRQRNKTNFTNFQGDLILGRAHHKKISSMKKAHKLKKSCVTESVDKFIAW